MTSPPLLVIAGSTATGKSGLAIRVATRLRESGLGAEIISADSRQVYRGLDIGTAKVPPAERGGIPHHGLDLVEPDEPFTVADFASHARTVLAVMPPDAVAILVGGTGLYLRAVARGLATDELPSDPAARREIEEQLADRGLDVLAAELRRRAPRLAERVDQRNPRRVVRALEIAAVQGDAPLPAPRGYPGRSAWLGLDLDRAMHREWIAARARTQFVNGLVEEARMLRERFDPSLSAFSAIGYREAWWVLDGKVTEEQAIAEDARRNVAFAKRQRTWFRAEPGIEWLDATSPELDLVAADAARRLL